MLLDNSVCDIDISSGKAKGVVCSSTNIDDVFILANIAGYDTLVICTVYMLMMLTMKAVWKLQVCTLADNTVDLEFSWQKFHHQLSHWCSKSKSFCNRLASLSFFIVMKIIV